MLPIYRENKEAQPKVESQAEQTKTLNLSIAGNKLFFISLGCPRNLVDTETMIGILLHAGYEISPELSLADYIIINTCGFLESSRQESLTTIKESLAERKKDAKVIATGCMVQTHSEVIKNECPEIHYLVGSGDVPTILNAVESKSQGSSITSARSYLEMGEVPRTLSTPKHYAYLKIAEGCRKRCAFCVIPVIKGPLKSKPVERVQKEIDILLNKGVKEIILIAQDLGDYGKDNGFKKSDGLVHLLKEVLKNEKRHFWLRLLYLYPDEITDELIQLMKDEPRILHYIDMPIQHINNDMLKAMRRTTSREDIIKTIENLRSQIPDIVIRTTLMVGFPGETEEQFQELERFVNEHPLENIGMFTYSNEESAHSSTLPNHISEEIKEERLKRLVKAQQKVVKKLQKKMVGKTLDVVIEGFHKETNLLAVGRYYGQSPEIDGQIIINDLSGISSFGEIYPVEIIDHSGYDLIGHVVKNKEKKDESKNRLPQFRRVSK